MKLDVHFKNCRRDVNERVRLEHIFKLAVLDYCASVEKLSQMKDDDPLEYLQTMKRGWWALDGHIPATEIAALKAELRFTK